MKYILLLLLVIFNPSCYALEAGVQRQLHIPIVDVQEVTESGVLEQGMCCQRSCVVPALVLIILVAYILIHKSLHESGSLISVE